MERGRYVKFFDFVERSEWFAASQDAVWEAITKTELLSEWFGMKCLELALKPGGRVVFQSPDGRKRPAIVEEVEAPRRLIFKWLPFEIGPDGSTDPVPGSTVELTLVDKDGGVELTVRETAVPLRGSVRIDPPLIGREDSEHPPRLVMRR